jgi:hypothetical protein
MSKCLALIFTVLGLLTLGNAAPVAAQTFVNGCFEDGASTGWDLIDATNTPGWTPIYGAGTAFPRINLNQSCGGPFGNNNEACQFVTIGGIEDGGTSALNQTISGFTVGTSYVLSWRQSSEFDLSDVVNASVIGVGTLSQDFTSVPYPGGSQFWYGWQTMSMPFVADATTLTFMFHSYGTNWEPGIDEVRISTVPPLTDFRDKRRGSEINVGTDLREGLPTVPHFTAVNFTGSTGSGGDTWVTVYDPTPGVPTPPTIYTGSISLSADVLIAKFNNAKGPGLLALYNQPPPAGAEGLALFLIDNGNTDRLVLATVTGSPTPGPASAPVTLATKPLGGGILNNHWYRLTMDVSVVGGSFSVTGKVFTHVDPFDPNSAVGPQVDGSLVFPLTTLASKGLTDSGEVGIVATATSAVVNSSVLNFAFLPTGSCQ